MEEDPQISEEEAEDREWIESLEYVIESSGRERASDLLRKLRIYSQKKGVRIPYTSNTPYVNTTEERLLKKYNSPFLSTKRFNSIFGTKCCRFCVSIRFVQSMIRKLFSQ